MNKKVYDFVLFVVIGLLFWMFLDYLYSLFISHSPYSFSANNLLIPTVVLVVVAYFTIYKK